MKYSILSISMLLIFCFNYFKCEETIDTEDTVRTTAASLIEERGKLPCDVRTSRSEDRPVLVLWYKDKTETPIYSFDARETSLQSGRHWSHDRLMGKRASFRLESKPSYRKPSKPSKQVASLGAYLELYPVRIGDGGIFRCRVDFLHSPTRNTVVTFTVVVPPQAPIIFNETNYRVGGGSSDSTIIGPYNEGDPLVLHCHVSGGSPRPIVEWFVNNSRFKAKPARNIGDVVRSSIIIEKLDREYLHSVLECRASNHNLTSLLTSMVTLDMNFRPLNVSIRSLERPLVAGSSYELICDSWGSRPPAVISWWKGGTIQMEERKVVTSHENGVSTSILRYRASTADNQKYLTCRAENLHIYNSAKEDGLQLNVLYRPVVTLQMGSSLDPKSIKEGDDVYFECHINANPEVSNVVWIHNGVQLHNDVAAGIIVQNQTLALQNVRRETAGNYSCRATNSEGGGSSNPLTLRVMFKPYCKKRPQTVYGASLHEPISVTCEVEAQPGPVTFRWTFNNTSEHLPISSAAVLSEDFTSTAVYIPKETTDYGTILCWAFNNIGEQKTPCAFSVIPAVAPESLDNCSIANQTTDAIEVDCDPGFDGGMVQKFHMEVYNARTQIFYRNLSSNSSSFTLKSFKPGLPLLMMIYASNAKGRSKPQSLETFTLKIAEKRTSPPSFLQLTPAIGVMLGTSAALTLIVVVIFIFVRAKRPSGDNTANRGADYADNKMNFSERRDKFDKSSPESSSRTTIQSTIATKGKNPNKLEEVDPDVIPQNNVHRHQDIELTCKNSSIDYHETQLSIEFSVENKNRPSILSEAEPKAVSVLKGMNNKARSEKPPREYNEEGGSQNSRNYSMSPNKEVTSVRIPLLKTGAESVV